MLNCIYHIDGHIEVVEEDEIDSFLARGVWFDHPLKAKAALDAADAKRKEAKDEIKDEPVLKKARKKPKGE